MTSFKLPTDAQAFNFISASETTLDAHSIHADHVEALSLQPPLSDLSDRASSMPTSRPSQPGGISTHENETKQICWLGLALTYQDLSEHTDCATDIELQLICATYASSLSTNLRHAALELVGSALTSRFYHCGKAADIEAATTLLLHLHRAIPGFTFG